LKQTKQLFCFDHFTEITSNKGCTSTSTLKHYRHPVSPAPPRRTYWPHEVSPSVFYDHMLCPARDGSASVLCCGWFAAIAGAVLGLQAVRFYGEFFIVCSWSFYIRRILSMQSDASSSSIPALACNGLNFSYEVAPRHHANCILFYKFDRMNVKCANTLRRLIKTSCRPCSATYPSA
jgi:hypothetical protein